MTVALAMCGMWSERCHRSLQERVKMLHGDTHERSTGNVSPLRCGDTQRVQTTCTKFVAIGLASDSTCRVQYPRHGNSHRTQVQTGKAMYDTKRYRSTHRRSAFLMDFAPTIRVHPAPLGGGHREDKRDPLSTSYVHPYFGKYRMNASLKSCLSPGCTRAPQEQTFRRSLPHDFKRTYSP